MTRKAEATMAGGSACRGLPEVRQHEVIMEEGEHPAGDRPPATQQATAVDDHRIVILVIPPAP